MMFRYESSNHAEWRIGSNMENLDTHANIGMGIDPAGDRSGASPVDERLQKALDKTLYAGGRPAAQKVRNFLNGTWLGEPLHVVLKDVPTGAWTVAMVFDVLDLVLDRPEFAVAADTSVAIGIAGAAGATLAGVTDWSDVDPPARRLAATSVAIRCKRAAASSSR